MVLPPDPARARCIPTDDDILGPFYEPGTPRRNTICTQDPQYVSCGHMPGGLNISFRLFYYKLS